MTDKFFPIFINLSNSSCLIVGGGEVGCRKLQDLIASNVAHIIVVESNVISKELESIVISDTRIELLFRPFKASDIRGMHLVFAVTNDKLLNKFIVEECKQNGIMCDSASDVDDNDFIVPSCVRQNSISIAISTHGASPALSRKIKEDLTPIASKYALLSEVLRRIRPHVLGLNLSSNDNAVIFRRIVNSALIDTLNSHDMLSSFKVLSEVLPNNLHKNVKEVLNGLW